METEVVYMGAQETVRCVRPWLHEVAVLFHGSLRTRTTTTISCTNTVIIFWTNESQTANEVHSSPCETQMLREPTSSLLSSGRIDGRPKAAQANPKYDGHALKYMKQAYGQVVFTNYNNTAYSICTWSAPAWQKWDSHSYFETISMSFSLVQTVNVVLSVVIAKISFQALWLQLFLTR